MDIGERIRYVRRFRGLTQTELAERIGLPADENGRIRISQYENGVMPKPEMLKKMSEVLDVDPRYFNAIEPTNALSFIYTLLEWDRECEFIITKGENNNYDMIEHYNVDFNNFVFNDFMPEWFQMKNDLKQGKITKEDYIEWTINLSKKI